MMKRNHKKAYYILWYRLDENDYYLIWFSTENDDGVLVNSEGRIPSFKSISGLKKYAEKHKIQLKDEEPILHNLDVVKNSLNQKDFEIDCVEFLHTWNLFADISLSVKENFNSDRKLTYKTYEKLFWGSNLPAVTPKGEFYKPNWSKKELKLIRETLHKGFDIFEKSVNLIK